MSRHSTESRSGHNADTKTTSAGGEDKHSLDEQGGNVHIERVFSNTEQSLKGDHQDTAFVDAEVQKYTTGAPVVIDEETNKRLKKMIDRRVLVIMILTYLLQALDKGTMSFASIMGIKEDAHLEGGQKVG